MKVKVIDESHEKDLERSINAFLCSGNYKIIDIKFSTSISIFSNEQVYCFSALIMYNDN